MSNGARAYKVGTGKYIAWPDGTVTMHRPDDLNAVIPPTPNRSVMQRMADYYSRGSNDKANESQRD